MSLVSVIMSVYKEPASWLSLSIDSILFQTHTNFEFIIVCDNPEAVVIKHTLIEYAQKDKRIKLIFNSENIGLTKSLNKALKASTGDFIARMDADDISVPTRLEKQLESFYKNRNIDILFSNFDQINEQNKIIRKKCVDIIFATNNGLLLQNSIPHPTVMMKRQVLNARNPLYNENFRTSQDYELWLFLVNKGYKIKFINDSLLKYRISSNQTRSLQGDIQKTAFDKIRKDAIINILMEIGLQVESNDSLENTINKINSKHISNHYKKKISYILFLMYYTISEKKRWNAFRYFFNRNLIWSRVPLCCTKYMILILFGKISIPRFILE